MFRTRKTPWGASGGPAMRMNIKHRRGSSPTESPRHSPVTVTSQRLLWSHAEPIREPDRSARRTTGIAYTTRLPSRRPGAPCAPSMLSPSPPLRDMSHEKAPTLAILEHLEHVGTLTVFRQSSASNGSTMRVPSRWNTWNTWNTQKRVCLSFFGLVCTAGDGEGPDPAWPVLLAVGVNEHGGM